MKKFTSVKQRKGELGESLVCIYLQGRSFRLVERNYTRKCGEIDIIAEKGGIIHFIEVKSVSCEMGRAQNLYNPHPSENMHSLKQRKMARIVAVYLASHTVFKWQCDLACVYLDDIQRKGRVEVLTDIIL